MCRPSPRTDWHAPATLLAQEFGQGFGRPPTYGFSLAGSEEVPPVSTDASGMGAVPVLPSPAIAGFLLTFQFGMLDPAGAYHCVLSFTGGLEVVGGL